MKSLVCITGATGGLGKAFAVECAQRGWDLFLTDISEEALSNLSMALSNIYGVNIFYRPCDLTDHAARKQLFDCFKNQDMQFWCLINVAGLDYEGPFAERTHEQIRTIVRVNIEANLEMTYTILELRDRSRVFRLVNVSSLAAFYPMPVKAIYSASKRFLLNFSLALREEIRSMGGTVTALCPAGMPTHPACIRAIEAQGFAGRITTKNVGYVAARTIDHALKGHPVYIPGRLNQLLRLLGSLVPDTLVARLIGNRWNESQQKQKSMTNAAKGSANAVVKVQLSHA